MKPHKTIEWSPKKRQSVLTLIETGVITIAEIVEMTNVPRSTVYDIKKRHTPFSKPRIGRPCVLSAVDKRRLNRHIIKNMKTRRQSPATIIKELGFKCSEQTLINALHELGYARRVARRRPSLKNSDKKRRLAFANSVRHWTIADWKKVIFTDEMAIKLYMSRKSRDWIWRKPNEEFHRDCIDYRKRSTGTGMMFWGAFRYRQMGPGLFFDLGEVKTINSAVYRDQILLGPLKTFWLATKRKIRGVLVMEDNAPVHKKLCIPVRQKLKIKSLPHPPNSPDLNPIEHIWAWMKARIAEQYSQVSSKEEMKRIVMEMWDAFGDDQFNRLIESMPDRIQAVIKAKGGATKY